MENLVWCSLFKFVPKGVEGFMVPLEFGLFFLAKDASHQVDLGIPWNHNTSPDYRIQFPWRI